MGLWVGCIGAWQAQARGQSVPGPGSAGGTVVISSDHLEAGAAVSGESQGQPDALPQVAVTNAERAGVVVTAYYLDVHLTPAEGREEVRAVLTVRNRSTVPVMRIPLQISSSLRWIAVSNVSASGLRAMAFTQAPVQTDADHTGYAQEAVLTPAEALGAGASLTVSVFYVGEIRQSAARLELIGTPVDRAAAADWDAIAPTTDAGSTALRGFGDVLWYPVAAETALLGDGNRLFELVARNRRDNAGARMRLRLTVEYVGDPPDAAILNGRAQALVKAPDEADQLIDETHGVATAEFAEVAVGFRTPSLFLTAQRAVTTPDQLLSVFTPEPETIEPYAAAAASLEPLLAGWFGAAPLGPLMLLEHRGQPFADGAFVAAHLTAPAKPAEIAPELVRPMTHAWFRAEAPTSVWLDQGMAEFMTLLWTEKTQGRERAIAELQHASLLIALGEPDPAGAGTPLTEAFADVLLRLKSASVLWQLRELVGEDTLRQAISGFRHSLSINATLGGDRAAFQGAVERASKQDLGWFFDDWVYRDRGLPDLSITQVNPRLLPARPGKNAGYLVAVEVRNEGEAVADVPVTVRSGTLTSTERLRVAGRSSASTRVLFEGTPESVQVNDGSTPELRTTVHTIAIHLRPES